MKKVLFYLLVLTTTLVNSQKITFEIDSDEQNHKIVFTDLTDKVLKSVFEANDNFIVDYLGLDEGYYLLKKDEHEVLLYLKPSDDLRISFENDNFYNTLAFSGEGSNVNNYLLTKYFDRVDRKGNLQAYYKKGFYEGDEEAYLTRLDEYYKEKYGVLFSRRFDKKFSDLEMNDLKYAHNLDLLKYQDAKKHYKMKDSLQPSDYFLEPLNDVDNENFELYKRHNSYKEYAVLKWSKDIINTEDYQQKKEIFNSIKNKPLRERVLKYLFFSLKRNTPAETELYYSLIKKNSSSRQLFAESKAKYEEIQYKEAAKNLSKFKFKDLEDNKASLAKYKGKYIFIKIWTSFCKPCIQDLKELDKLSRKQSKDEIEFVGVSVDKLEKFETWKEVVASNNIQIPQLFFNDSRHLFFETYDISQIPAFIILSKKGIPIDINIKNFNTKKVDNIIRDLLKRN